MHRRAFLASAAAAPLVGLGGCGRARESEHVRLRAVQRQLAHAFARSFGLRHDEDAIFDAGWDLYDRIVGLAGREDAHEVLRKLQAEAEASVDGAMRRVREAALGRPPDLLGYRHVGRLPARGRYVITSDHHATYFGHRTSQFGRLGNLWLYVDAMRRYHDAGYTLIENGDVEELVIFDPEYEPGEVEARRGLDLPELVARRLGVRASQLQRSLSDPDNRALVEVRAAFDAGGRLVRTAGNHDYDTQRDDFLGLLKAPYPNLARPYDVVAIEDASGPRVLVVHGHQLDIATNPVSAPRFGETVSETLGVYYQGADRIWLWRPDGVVDWATGKKPFGDQLVSREQGIASDLDLQLDDPETPFDPWDHDRAQSVVRGLMERRGEGLLEHLFKQNIAWQYFLTRDPDTGLVEPARAIMDEVLTGDRFFKYELVDEDMVRRQLIDAWPDPATRPVLVLGHTHEPRVSPWAATEGARFPWYVNTASAGQFQNLLWAAEVVDGQVSIVSWSRVPPPSGPLERRVWRPQGDGPWSIADAAPSEVL